MSNTLAVTAFVITPIILLLFIFGTWVRWIRRLIFPLLALVALGLTGIAAYRDSAARGYVAIQDQYKQDYPTSKFDSQVQQVFPAFQAAKVGDTFRTERCISCHVPDLSTIGPGIAAQRLAQDFMKYEPNARQLIEQDHMCAPVATCTPTHPAVVVATDAQATAYNKVRAGSALSYQTYGAYDAATGQGSQQMKSTYIDSSTTPPKKLPIPEPGYIGLTNVGSGQSVLDPSNSSSNANGNQIGIDAAGCIVCHNGSRLALDESTAHQNLIVNPTYVWSEGAALYYQYCVSCHAANGSGAIGPPLSNQDRLGFFNEDYYYRCIEYGMTGFEHYDSKMPNWGSISSTYVRDGSPLATGAAIYQTRQLSEAQIDILIQFIRHWENYTTLP